METITNIASTATSTVSNLIYGDQTKNNETAGKEPISGEEGKGTATEPFDKGNAATPLDTTADKKTFLDYSNNETAGTEPVSGQQGKGTASEPFDQGNSAKATNASSGSNDFLKLNPKLDGPEHDEGAPKIHTNTSDSTYTGMPIVPLNPDVASSGLESKPSGATENTGITDKAGATDKVWKETALDDISRSGAPGAGPTAPGAGTASTETYQGSATPLKEPNATETTAIKESKERAEQSLDGTVSPKTTGTPIGGAVGESKSLVGEKPTHKSEPTVGSPTSDEKSGKTSKLTKLKDKLHIGHKDK
ncbi:Nn.00g002560.m01.CDS01 [Neocucurbitaria sp. VM-36]